MTETAPLTRDDLVGVMSKGAKPKTEWRVGAEHEKFGFDQSTLRRPAYEGPNGILAMLTGLQRFGWTPVEEAGHVIALERKNAEGYDRLDLAWSPAASSNCRAPRSRPSTTSATRPAST